MCVQNIILKIQVQIPVGEPVPEKVRKDITMKAACEVTETTLTGLNVDGEAITRIVFQAHGNVVNVVMED